MNDLVGYDVEATDGFVSMTKVRVKSAPDFDDLQRSVYDDKYDDSVDSYYGGYRDW